MCINCLTWILSRFRVRKPCLLPHINVKCFQQFRVSARTGVNRLAARKSRNLR